MSGDYGAIGNDVPGSRATFTVGAALRVPLFEGGRVQARVREAEARVAAGARAPRRPPGPGLLRGAVGLPRPEGGARSAWPWPKGARSLAREQLQQAKDRFASGVADNVEVVQAQEALAAAAESHIASLYAQNVARLSLARALGGVETSYAELLKGR